MPNTAGTPERIEIVDLLTEFVRALDNRRHDEVPDFSAAEGGLFFLGRGYQGPRTCALDRPPMSVDISARNTTSRTNS